MHALHTALEHWEEKDGVKEFFKQCDDIDSYVNQRTSAWIKTLPRSPQVALSKTRQFKSRITQVEILKANYTKYTEYICQNIQIPSLPELGLVLKYQSFLSNVNDVYMVFEKSEMDFCDLFKGYIALRVLSPSLIYARNRVRPWFFKIFES